jgi:hypothetical protein
MKREIETSLPVGSDALVPPLRLIDLDSPWLFGIGRDMTDEERENAERHGRDDNPPMSVLGVTHEGLAAVDGKELAQLFVAAPEMAQELIQCEAILSLGPWSGTLNRVREVLTKALGPDWQNDDLTRPDQPESGHLETEN